MDSDKRDELVDDILLHYGVKGMKWDKEKKKDEVSYAKTVKNRALEKHVKNQVALKKEKVLLLKSALRYRDASKRRSVEETEAERLKNRSVGKKVVDKLKDKIKDAKTYQKKKKEWEDWHNKNGVKPYKGFKYKYKP